MNDDADTLSIVQQPDDKTRIIASANTWIEGEAVRQLQATAKMPGMRYCVGLPDMQPGKGSPSGAAFASGLIQPHLVGTDSGCGIALFRTDLKAHKINPKKMAALLDGLDHPWDGDTAAWLTRYDVTPTASDASLGTPGHSNHFIEVQWVLEVRDEAAFSGLGLDRDHACIVVHSGSRGFGESVLYAMAAVHGASGLDPESADGLAYRKAHEHAVRWAIANRALCGHRTMTVLGATGERVLDICHNAVQAYTLDNDPCWLHRKGAAPSDQGPVLIPGSRNDVSFLVDPHPNPLSLHSLAHGAGRKIARGEAKGKLQHHYKVADLQQNRWGGCVVCGERDLLWEEAGDCYKDVSGVIDDLASVGLLSVIAVLRPLVTFKTSEGARVVARDSKERWQRERQAARAAKRSLR